MLKIQIKLLFFREICAIMPPIGQIGGIRRNLLEFKLEKEVPNHLRTGREKIAA
jgi:hypothetical protein